MALVGAQRRLEVTERLTYWTAPHPLWQPNPDWPEDVGSVLYKGDDALVLIDPLIRDDLEAGSWDWLDAVAADSPLPTAVLLTAAWHERSTRAAVARYGASVWAAPRAQARLAGLRLLDRLPRGIAVFEPRGVDQGQVAFIVPGERSVVIGELFLGTESGLRLCPSPVTDDLPEFVESVAELERLSIERVLVSHGPPVLTRGREAIAAAVRAFGSD
jgi:glyoxylase-like metal-dependent hydrolase (beta-lactamase superfamily II)